jgi:transcriptional regulator with XRE-family HTH domain
LNHKEREELGIKLKQARISKRLTPAQVSSRIGHHFSLIERLERGEVTLINEAMLQDLFKNLDIEL